MSGSTHRTMDQQHNAPRDGERTYAPQVVARVLGLPLRDVLAWIKAGRIRAHTTPGGRLRVSERMLRRAQEEIATRASIEKAEE